MPRSRPAASGLSQWGPCQLEAAICWCPIPALLLAGLCVATAAHWFSITVQHVQGWGWAELAHWDYQYAVGSSSHTTGLLSWAVLRQKIFLELRSFRQLLHASLSVFVRPLGRVWTRICHRRASWWTLNYCTLKDWDFERPTLCSVPGNNCFVLEIWTQWRWGCH